MTETKAKHTPGPWCCHYPPTLDMDYMDITFDDDGNGSSVAHVFESLHPGGESDGQSWKLMEANARLIAAAPDLLTAAEAVVAIAANINPREPAKLIDEKTREILRWLDPAIARAKGETR